MFVTVVAGDAAVSVDRGAKTVTTESGQEHAYDVLVLATGSRPFVPPVGNSEATGCFVYRTLDDVEAIAAMRRDILAALTAPATETPWPAPYVARRIAWHALDHAWEMEDKRDF